MNSKYTNYMNNIPELSCEYVWNGIVMHAECVDLND